MGRKPIDIRPVGDLNSFFYETVFLFVCLLVCFCFWFVFSIYFFNIELNPEKINEGKKFFFLKIELKNKKKTDKQKDLNQKQQKIIINNSNNSSNSNSGKIIHLNDK